MPPSRYKVAVGKYFRDWDHTEQGVVQRSDVSAASGSNGAVRTANQTEKKTHFVLWTVALGLCSASIQRGVCETNRFRIGSRLSEGLIVRKV